MRILRLRGVMSPVFENMMLLEYNAISRNIAHHLRRKYSKNVASKWKSVVGLEVHAQITSNSKLFSGASNEFASPVNNNVSLFDCAIPGTLPVLNKKCVEAGVLTALALNCKVNPVSTFDRKHYFYADMPAGYQITQQRSPLANEGYLQFQVFTPGVHKTPYQAKARIKQLQLEQDSGKSMHDFDRSLVDLNRAGTPLMELVFEPDLCDGEEAAALIKELCIILQRIGSCSCKMEEGALRVDANISVHQPGEPLGTRAEVKNIGSVRGVAGAVKYEINRQIGILEEGGKIVNETRAWDAAAKRTLPMRDKEQQQDYRYMPEPNLPPLQVGVGPVEKGCVHVNDLEKELPEMPEETRKRLRKDYGLTSEQAIILVNESILLSMFEHAVSEKKISDYKLLTNILINELLMVVHKEKKSLEEVAFIKGETISEIVVLIEDGTISKNTSRLVLNEIITGNASKPMKIVEINNWIQINDSTEIERICQEVINENPKAVGQYKGGKSKVFNAFMGWVAKKTNRPVNMKKANDILKKMLD